MAGTPFKVAQSMACEAARSLGGPPHGPLVNPFEVHGAVHSPARPTTLGLESSDPPPSPFSLIGHGHQNMAQVQWNAVNAVQHQCRPVSFEIRTKKNETLKIFNGGLMRLKCGTTA